ncbi:hypothetical protein [Bacillus cereus group sp. N15]|uniref:hypothetical protein n=1 Tax=Bacillus cereus group sp. N15 TaxID=2794588 RepID=UPI0018F3EB32|nr:hypothetical protein [Bacillus cereus group sp. N15]MBJ8063380.1 hypothetical protein [Bacillus cereus group sp. N15]
MFTKKANNIFNKALNEINEMNHEYEKMKTQNSAKSSEIRSAIQMKSKKFHSNKQDKNGMFSFIRSK